MYCHLLAQKGKHNRIWKFQCHNHTELKVKKRQHSQNVNELFTWALLCSFITMYKDFVIPGLTLFDYFPAVLNTRACFIQIFKFMFRFLKSFNDSVFYICFTFVYTIGQFRTGKCLVLLNQTLRFWTITFKIPFSLSGVMGLTGL